MPVATDAVARHFELHRNAVVERMLRRLEWAGGLGDGDSGPATRFAFLAEYHVTPPSAGLWDEQVEAFEAATPEHLPLRAAPGGRLAGQVLVAAGLIEEDIRFGSLFSALQEPLVARRPCVGLLAWMLADPGDASGRSDIHACCQRLVASGLLAVDNPADPRAEWVMRLPVVVWDAIRGTGISAAALPSALRYRPASSFPPLDEVVVSGEARPVVPRLGDLVTKGNLSALVVRGMDGSGRLTLLGSLARQLGRDVLVHEGQVGDEGWRLLGPLAALTDAFAVVVVRPGPGETLQLPALAETGGPVGIVVGRAGGLDGALVDRALSLTLTACDLEDRRTLWAATGIDSTGRNLDEIVERFLLTPGNIHRVAPMAAAAASADDRDKVEPGDVRIASRALSRQVLETLATALPALSAMAAPVLTPAAEAEMATLRARCRHRERLAEQVGDAFRGNLNRGVRALFTGPSGTGKTLAARQLAGALNLDLYRVNLAAVVNKYIGETERNLDLVLSRAEELDVVLLLDEGDALMAPRTDVGNANDRYANLETNYLLQRLETFEGIVVITTNAGSRIDSAFLRRIDATIEFVPPDAGQRWLIWQAHLPTSHVVAPEVLEDVARRCALTGGHIRNAALHAALVALNRGSWLNADDLFAGLRREYQRLGASFPMQLGGTRA